jgi:methyl-accepting chemotaxis protein
MNSSQLPAATDAQVFDLSGRQRMLNQRFMKEVLAGVLGGEADYETPLKVLRQTAIALASGGEAAVVPGQKPSIAVRASSNEVIRGQFGLQVDLLDALEEAGRRLLLRQPSDTDLNEYLSSFLAAGTRVHAAADKATQMLVAQFQLEKEVLEASERETTQSIRRILTLVAAQSQELAGSSGQLSATSREMRADAEETSSKAALVSDASGRISQIVQSMATATEQLKASIQEISSHASQAAQTAITAIIVATDTNQAVSRLGESSAGIGHVVRVITSVAQQTNLLALNATIEAARAGESGKGFAVVAHEVKELAKQTAYATDEITQKIEAIRADTLAAINTIRQIHEIIGRLSEASHTIAAAAEQQTAVTKEIFRNLTGAASGVSEIASGITSVADAAHRTSARTEESQRAADGLSKMAAELQKVVSLAKT